MTIGSSRTKSGILARVVDDVRAMGLAGWGVYAVSTALERLSKRRIHLLALRFYVQPVANRRLVPPRPANDPIRIGPLPEGTFDPHAFDRPRQAIEDRYRDGSICIGAVREGELVGFMWLQHGILRERLVRCRMHAMPADRVAWDYDFEIHPRYRLGRLFGRLWDCAFEILREQGVRATVSWVRLGNRASEQAHARLGARRIGWAFFVTVFGWQLMLSSLRPKIAFTAPGRACDLYVDLAGHSVARNHTPDPARG